MLSYFCKRVCLAEGLVCGRSKQSVILNRVIQSRKSIDSLVQTLTDTSSPGIGQDEEFRVLDLKKVSSRQKRVQRQKTKFEIPPPRTSLMKENQDWASVWPGPRTFHPAVVPLPVRQGHNKKKAPPGKYANAELMKIPNFLHLTPPAVEKHCAALRQFCTQWPAGLETDELCERHFPVEVITSDYCHSSPKIRDPLARIVTIKFRLSRLALDRHARDKIRRLVGDRYDEQTDVVTITTDKCPLRQQNYDYAMYLLTALYHESWRLESWEKEKSLEDMECYEWEHNQSYRNILDLLSRTRPDLDPDNLPDDVKIKIDSYKSAVEDLFNDNKNESLEKLQRYKEASLQFLF